MVQSKNPKASSIKAARSSQSTGTRSSNSSIVSGASRSGNTSEIQSGTPARGRAQQQRRETVTIGGGVSGLPSHNATPVPKSSYRSEQSYQQTPSTLREQSSKASILTESSGTSVRTAASENNGATALTHPAQGGKIAAAARAREQSEERRRVKDAERQRERDASRERFEKNRLEAQKITLKGNPEEEWWVREAERISSERLKDRGKRVRPEDRERQRR